MKCMPARKASWSTARCKIVHLVLHRSNDLRPLDCVEIAARMKKRPAGRSGCGSADLRQTGAVSIRFGDSW